MRSLLRVLAVVVLVGSGAGSARAEGEGGEATPPRVGTSVERHSVPTTLELGRRPVVTFRAAVYGYAPADRARAARRRALEAYLRNPNPSIGVVVTSEGAQLTADGKVLFVVVPEDVDQLAGDTPDSVAGEAAAAIRTILKERAEREDPREVAIGLGIALAATLLAFVLLRSLLALRGWANLRLAALIDGRLQQSASGQVLRVNSALMWSVVRALVRVGLSAGALTLAFVWLDTVLLAVPHTRPWGSQLIQVTVGVLTRIGTSVLDALPGLLFVTAILILARLVSRVGRTFFDSVAERDLKLGWLDRDTATPARMVFSLLAWLFAVAMAYPYLPGAESRAFQGVSVLFGLMVSVGASGTVGQALSGFILMFTRSYRATEYVRIQGTEGTVVELGLFTTRIRTGMGEEVVLPNVHVLSGSMTNYSRAVPGTGFVLDAVVTIGYDTPWRQVQAMLMEAARRVDAITAEPAPRAMQTALNDFYVEYRLIAYSKAQAPLPRAQAISALHASIQDVFNEYGVQIMSPHYLGDPRDQKLVPKPNWAPAPAQPLDADPP